MSPRCSIAATGLLLLCCLAVASQGYAQTVPASPKPSAAGGGESLRPRVHPTKPAHSSVPPGHDPHRLEVKFRDGLEVEMDASGVPFETRGGALRSARSLDVLRRLRDTGARWKRAAALDRATLGAIRSRAQAALHREIADLAGYFVLTLPPGARAQDWMDALNALPEVELASPLPLPMRAPLPPDLEPLQGYLDSAPEGSDAHFAWTVPGGTGAGVSICDLEYSWNLSHEDLPPATVLIPGGEIPFDPFNEEYHGTAVLGEMFSLRNGWGMTGGSYEARCFVAPVEFESGYGLFQAILLATSRLEAGDVLLIEQQTAGPYYRGDESQLGCVPVEWDYPVYSAILAAVGNGIHVVEAAGNGSQDLDDPVYAAGNAGHAPFLPENNSGAILVGAGVPPTSAWRGPDRSRLEFSNYGSRLDLQGWGVSVPTTGLGDLYSADGPNLTYTRSFGGTSSAAPIVASSVASVEGAVEHQAGTAVSPAIMRSLLASTGSPQQDGVFPATQRIGPRPDLRAAYGRMDEPIVAAPMTAHAFEGDSIRIAVEAADLDGDPIATLTASPLPAGATFTTTADHAVGILAWGTGRGQAGSYAVTFTASNAGNTSATTWITVESAERGPVVTSPGAAWGLEGQPLLVDVAAADPNGDPIVSFEASNLPAGASFTTDSTNSHGRLLWTPDYTQAGQYVVTLTAVSVTGGAPNGPRLSGSGDLVLTIFNMDRPPVVAAPASVSGAEGEILAFIVTAADPDGDPIAALRADRLPPGATFESNAAHTGGAFTWIPGYDQAGSYMVDFIAENSQPARASTGLSIRDTDRAPIVVAPERVPGAEGMDVVFDATAADPDGDPIVSFEASGLPPGSQFVVASTRTSAHFAWTPHYGQAGRYSVTLLSSSLDRADPGSGAVRTGSATVALVIESGVFPARVFLEPDDRTIRLGAGRPQACVRIEPMDGLFGLAEIVPDSTAMVSAGTGSVSRVQAMENKVPPMGDRDRNGIEDQAACFAIEDLRLLFANLPAGRRAVDVTVEGALRRGGHFRGTVALEVVSQRRLRDVRVTPNPARAGSVLSFYIRAGGPVRARIFDAQGRLVRVVLDAPACSPGYHDVPLGAEGGTGALPTGVYFYRLETPDGDARGRIVIVK